MTVLVREGIHDLPLQQFTPDCPWQIRLIGDVADVLGGGTPDTDLVEFWDPPEIPWATPTDITGTRGNEIHSTARCISAAGLKASTLVPQNSVLMTSRATIGAAKINRVPMAINQGFAALCPKDGTSTEYLFYLLDILRPALIRLGAGTTFLELSRRDVRNVRVRLPDGDEQKRIAAAIRLADDAITNARAELDATQDLTRSLEAGLLTGQMDSKGRIKARTREGELPSDWTVTPLKSLTDIGSGVTLNQDRAPKENACRYLTVAHVQRGRISNDDDSRFLDLTPQERQTRLLKAGDVLVVEGHASSMEIGRAAMFQDQGEPTTFQNHLFRVRADSDQILPNFLLYILNSERVQRHWNAVCNTSSGLNTINRRNLRNLLIQRPNIDEQRNIVSTLEAAELNIANLVQKVGALAEVKLSLLQNLLTGKIRIPEGAIDA